MSEEVVTGIQGPGMGACRDRVGHVGENSVLAHRRLEGVGEGSNPINSNQ